MALHVSGENTPVYNEPSKEFKGDAAPELRRVLITDLDRLVRVRIELERRLLMCGVDPQPDRPEFTAAHAAVLLVMLQESDSPAAARLRGPAAAWAGANQVQGATPVLREIVLDEADDLQTRLNAIQSYVELVGDEAIDVFDKVLASPSATIRTMGYRVALTNRWPKLAELALGRLATERNRRVRAAVLRRSALLQQRDSTLVAPAARRSSHRKR